MQIAEKFLDIFKAVRINKFLLLILSPESLLILILKKCQFIAKIHVKLRRNGF